MTRTSVKRMIAGGMAALGILAVAPTASAVPGYECPADALGCLYDLAHGNGDRYVVRQCDYYDLPGGWWDRVESYASKNVRYIGFYSYQPSGGLWDAGRGHRFLSETMPSYRQNIVDRIGVECG